MMIDLNIVFLTLALLSMAVSFFAIWQASTFKRESDASAKQAQDALADLKSEAKALREYAIPELKNYGDAMREFMFKSELRQSVANEVIAPTTLPVPTPTTTATPVPTPALSASTTKNLRKDILDTITNQIHTQGKAHSMMVFNQLTDRYDFRVIYNELISLREDGIVRWAGDQDAPGPHVAIEIV